MISISEAPPPNTAADLVVANLYLGVLTVLIPELVVATRPGGLCVISGITIDGEGVMVQLMEEHCCILERRVERDGWLGLAFRRRADPKENG